MINTRKIFTRLSVLLVLPTVLAGLFACGDNTPADSETTVAGEATSADVTETEKETEPETEPEPEITEAPDDGQALKAILLSSSQLKSKCTKVLQIPAPGDGYYPQGGTSDGKYYYQSFILKDTASNEANNIDRILKVDMETGKVVKSSKNLSLNHSNDITVFGEDGKLAVVHNNPNRTTVSVINPDTLTFERTVTVPYQIYCMNYNASRDKFVVGLSGGQNFCYLSGEMKLGSGRDRVTKIATPLTAGYVTQGCSCDDNFIYFVLYSQNVITVYDWDGNLVTIIELDVGKLEPENIAVVGNTIYVTCASNGAAVYKVEPYAG